MTRLRFIPAIGVLFATLAMFHATVDAQGAEAAANIIFAGNTKASTFPFEWRKETIVVPVRVNGSRPLLFVLDTGSSRMLVYRTLADSLQGAGTGRIPVEFIQNVTISLPGVESAGYEFSTADLRPLESANGGKVDGILGYELFRRFVITIDYHSKNLTLTLPKAFHSEVRENTKTKMLPIELRGKWAFVKGELSFPGPLTVQDSFLIDTGSSDQVDHPVVMKIQARVPTTSGVGIGSSSQGALAHATSFTLAGYQIRNPVVTCCGATDATSTLIGNEVLLHFTVTFDYPSSRIFITPNQDY
jgi:hypothetical protein